MKMIEQLRDEIRKDMGDYKLLCCRIPIDNVNDYIKLFGNEYHYKFFKRYLLSRIGDNIKKLEELTPHVFSRTYEEEDDR